MPEFDSTIEYRDIEEFPGYKVGNDGSVWSCLKTIKLGWRYGSRSAFGTIWRELRLHKIKGHRSVTLQPGAQMRQVHRLVLNAFLGPCPPRYQCCHFDGNPSNNALSNLRWDTPSANMRDRARHGRQTTFPGEANPMAVLTAKEVRMIRKRYRKRIVSAPYLGDLFGVSPGTILAIVNRKTWRHI